LIECTFFQNIKQVYRMFLFTTCLLHFHSSFATSSYSRGSLFYNYAVTTRNDGKIIDKPEQENHSDTAENKRNIWVGLCNE